MKKALVALLPLAAVLGVLLHGASFYGESARFATVYVQGKPFRVEIADTPEKQALGLMFRRSLKEGYGMLFVFPDETERSFWMKNTLIRLDMIFLNSDQQVVDMFQSVPPCQADPCPSYTSAFPARYVLEIAGGLAEKLKLKLGDKVFIAID
jgi:uncharacterized membrane protein (UPF0127 family)